MSRKLSKICSQRYTIAAERGFFKQFHIMIINTKKIGYALSLFKRAYVGYKLQIVITTILGFTSGLASGIGISMLIPLFSFVARQNDPNNVDNLSHTVKRVFDFLHLGYNLPFILMVMVLLFMAKALITLTTGYMNVKISEQYLEDMRSLSMKKTLMADWPYLMNQKVGYVDSVILDDAAGGSGILKNISDAALGFTSLAAYTFVALNISFIITVISLGSGALIFLFLKPYFYKIRKLSEFLNQASKEANHHINESSIGIKTIKAFAIESQVINKGYSYFKKLKKAQIRSSFLGNIQGVLFEPVSLIFISLIFLFSYKNPSFNMVSFIVTIYLVKNMFSFIQVIQSKFNNINTALPSLEIMLAYQDATEQHKEISSGNQVFKFNESLKIQGLTFSYSETNNNILSNVSFSIQKGDMIGIIGPSGTGKTTLVDVLLRLLRPQNGVIIIDDIDIDSISLESWRKNIGYVSQDVFLINDTIEANIKFYSNSVSRDDVVTASKLANIYDFIQELPNKFDTPTGERGVKLSGGQKQRISLARALARKPSILILDEATSALDNESEALIQKAINNLKGKITVLVIAHRLSTVMNSDKIIVLDNGKVIETGTPQELIKNQDSYLYKSYHATQSNDHS